MRANRSWVYSSLAGDVGGDDPALAQRLDLGRPQAELCEDFTRMLADCRRLARQSEIVRADLNGQTRKLGGDAAGKVDLEHAAAGIELRIVEQVAGLGNRRKRNIEAVEDFGKRCARMLHDDCSDDRQQRWALAHAILIGLVRGVLQQIIPAKVFAEAMPLAVAL